MKTYDEIVRELTAENLEDGAWLAETAKEIARLILAEPEATFKAVEEELSGNILDPVSVVRDMRWLECGS